MKSKDEILIGLYEEFQKYHDEQDKKIRIIILLSGVSMGFAMASFLVWFLI